MSKIFTVSSCLKYGFVSYLLLPFHWFFLATFLATPARATEITSNSLCGLPSLCGISILSNNMLCLPSKEMSSGNFENMWLNLSISRSSRRSLSSYIISEITDKTWNHLKIVELLYKTNQNKIKYLCASKIKLRQLMILNNKWFSLI